MKSYIIGFVAGGHILAGISMMTGWPNVAGAMLICSGVLFFFTPR